MKRDLSKKWIIGLVGVTLVIIITITLWSRQRAVKQINTEDPMQNAKKLRGIPTVILFSDRGMMTDSMSVVKDIAQAIGTSCQVRIFPGFNYGPALLYDPKFIRKSIDKMAPKNSKVLLLPGWESSAASWFQSEGNSAVSGVKPKVGQFLKKDFDCIAVEIGGASFGNDSALRAIDKAAGPTGKVTFVSENTGALAMWRWAEKHPERVSGMVTIGPICSIIAAEKSPVGPKVRKAWGSL